MDHVEMRTMSNYPMQIIDMNLTGPSVKSLGGDKYVLAIIDHYSFWMEVYPIQDILVAYNSK